MSKIRQILFENYLGAQPFGGSEILTERVRRDAVLSIIEDLALGRIEPEQVGVSQNELADELVQFANDLLSSNKVLIELI
jgi:hypothetical protein